MNRWKPILIKLHQHNDERTTLEKMLLCGILPDASSGEEQQLSKPEQTAQDTTASKKKNTVELALLTQVIKSARLNMRSALRSNFGPLQRDRNSCLESCVFLYLQCVLFVRDLWKRMVLVELSRQECGLFSNMCHLLVFIVLKF